MNKGFRFGLREADKDILTHYNRPDHWLATDSWMQVDGVNYTVYQDKYTQDYFIQTNFHGQFRTHRVIPQ